MSDNSASIQSELQTTPLNALHIELGARMVPFAGYSMRCSTKALAWA